MKEFRIAATLDEALASLTEGFVPIAGGTDLVVAARHGKAPLPERLLSIERLTELAGIDSTDRGLVIGALVTHARLMSDSHVVDLATAVSDAAALVGSPSTRNVGTIGGNLMNASPAMDTGAPLMVLDAQIVLRSTKGERRLPVADLWIGPGATSAESNELCTAVLLPSPTAPSGSAYVRLEYRRAMEIAVVGAAARVDLDPDGSGRIVAASLALTAVAPTIVAVEGISEILSGADVADRQVGQGIIEPGVLADVATTASEQASPISDLRASDTYRRHCVGVMAKRAVAAAAARARGRGLAVPVNRATGIGAST